VTIPPERWLLMLFGVMFALGALDHLAGGRFGLGRKFLDGLATFPPLFLTMTGFLVLTPLLTRLLTPLVTPLFSAVGADPGLFAGIFLANDCGGYALAKEIAVRPEAAGFGGMLLGSLLGANMICMPLILQLMDRADFRCFFIGMMYGMITMPLGMIAGGMAAGYGWDFMLRQLPLLLVLAAAAALLLRFCPNALVKVLTVVAKVMEIISLSGASAAVFAELAGIRIPGIEPVGDALRIIGSIVIVLPGVNVLTEILARLLRRQLTAVGRWLGINENAVAGFLSTLANSVPTLSRIREMDPRGKVLNCAFISSGAFLLGDHLAFCSAVAPEFILPLSIAKATGAVSAVALALWWMKKVQP